MYKKKITTIKLKLHYEKYTAAEVRDNPMFLKTVSYVKRKVNHVRNAWGTKMILVTVSLYYANSVKSIPYSSKKIIS